MYFILRTGFNDKREPTTPVIVDHTDKTITVALATLEASARAFIREEYGKKAATDAAIIDIHSFDQVNEPLVDGMLIYRLGNDSNCLHIYERKTVTVPGYIYGQTIASTFRRVQIFTLVEYTNINIGSSRAAQTYIPVDMVPVGPANIKIPKALTTAPMCDVIAQLKKSNQFLKRFNTTNNSKQAAKPAVADIETAKKAEIVNIAPIAAVNIVQTDNVNSVNV